MFDGIKINYEINDFELWKKTVNIEFYTPIDLQTGEVKERIRNFGGNVISSITHKGNFQTYCISVKETRKNILKNKKTVSYFAEISGSLHKNYFEGNNYLPFKWDNLQTELSNLENKLNLSNENLQIVNLEIGVNIQTPFEVTPFLRRNLISYKGQSFNEYWPDNRGFVLGKFCKLSQYSVKIYDKGKQNNTPENIMRFELRFTKMAILKKRGIENLNSLKCFHTSNSLLSLLLNAWDNVLIFDSVINLKDKRIKPKHRRLLDKGNNPRYWEEMKEKNKREFNYKRNQFKHLVKIYGNDLHNQIKEMIKTEWENLTNNCTNLPSVNTENVYEFTVSQYPKRVQIYSLDKG